MTDLFAFKFLIQDGDWRTDPDDPAVSFCGVVAATIATTEQNARAQLERYAAENGFDSRWLKVAKVVRIPLIAGAVVAWAEA